MLRDGAESCMNILEKKPTQYWKMRVRNHNKKKVSLDWLVKMNRSYAYLVSGLLHGEAAVGMNWK